MSRLQGLLGTMEQRLRKVGTLPLQEANRQMILPAKVTLNHMLHGKLQFRLIQLQGCSLGEESSV